MGCFCLVLSLCITASVSIQIQKDSTRPSIYLLTFGKGLNFEKAQARLAAEAKTTGLFDHIYNYSALPDFIVNDKRWSEHLQHPSTGMGFWFWKAPLAKNLLNNVMREGDILVYADAGSELGNLTEFENVARALCSHDLLSYRVKHLEQEYTKGDVLVRFGVPLSKTGRVDPASPFATRQIESTYFVVKNTANSRRFIDTLEELFADIKLIGDEPSVVGNDRSFQVHRRDQSLFSMLLKANSPDIDAEVRADFPAATAMHPEFGIEGFRPFIAADVGYPQKPAKHWIVAARNHQSARKYTQAKASHLSEESVNKIKDLVTAC